MIPGPDMLDPSLVLVVLSPTSNVFDIVPSSQAYTSKFVFALVRALAQFSAGFQKNTFHSRFSACAGNCGKPFHPATSCFGMPLICPWTCSYLYRQYSLHHQQLRLSPTLQSLMYLCRIVWSAHEAWVLSFDVREAASSSTFRSFR